MKKDNTSFYELTFIDLYPMNRIELYYIQQFIIITGLISTVTEKHSYSNTWTIKLSEPFPHGFASVLFMCFSVCPSVHHKHQFCTFFPIWVIFQSESNVYIAFVVDISVIGHVWSLDNALKH